MSHSLLSRLRATLCCLLLFSSALLALACARNSVAQPMGGNRETLVLDANAVVDIMRQSGFTTDEIIELGPDLRNCLAIHGAAKIRIDNTVEALFAVHPPYVHVCSRRRGSLIYKVDANDQTPLPSNFGDIQDRYSSREE